MEAAQGLILIYLLDTNVVSQTAKERPNLAVMEWWQRQREDSLMVSAIVFQELRFGITSMPPGRKRDRLEDWLEIRLNQEFARRILPVTQEIAELSGRFIVETKQAGHMAEVADALIAATARVHRMTVATLNRNHFENLGVVLVEF